MESGERLAMPERVIVAPASGRFRADGVPEGDAIDVEQVIGFVEGAGHCTPVRTPFPGFLVGLLAHTGERVREGQPVAWLRTA